MKKIAVILVVLLALMGGAWFTLTSFIINSDEMAQEMRTALENATGRSVQLGSDADVSLFPPQVTFGGMRIDNIEGASTPDMLTAKKVVMKLDAAKLFTATAEPAEIVMEEAEFHFEVIPGGQKNWQFAGKGQQADSFRSYFIDTPVTLQNSTLNYVNAATGSHSEISQISGTIGYQENGAVVEYNGTVGLHGEPTQLMVRMRSTDITAPATEAAPFQFVLDRKGTVFKAQGQLSTAKGEPEFVGTMEVDAQNLWGVMALFTGGGSTSATGGEAAELKAQGNMSLSIRHVRLTDVAVHAGGDAAIPTLKGALDMEYRFGKNPYLNLKPDFETVDMDALMQSYHAWFDTAPAKQQGAEGEEETPIINPLAPASTEVSPYEAFLRIVSGAVNAKIDSLIYQGRSINNIRFNSTLRPEIMAIREGFANMPGETRMTFAGNLLTNEGVAFDGKFEMQGRKLEQFMSLFTPKNTDFPPLELGLFGVRTNVAINAEQFRFSEFQARIADTLMAGSVILHRNDRPKVESYLRIAKVNLDVVGKAVRFMLPADEGVQSSSEDPGGMNFDVNYLNTKFNWLNAVGVDIDSNFLINDFVLLDRKGKRAEFNLRMGVGTAAINNVKAEYNGSNIAGSYGVRVEQGQNPYVQVDTSISELDMVDLFPDLARARNDEEWDAYLDETLEMMLLQTYRADIKARIGKLNIRDYTFEKVNTEMHLDDSQLSIEKFTGYLWDGGLNARMAIQAGAIPSMSIAFALENGNLVRLSEASRLLKHAAGRVGISGQFSTSGVKLRSWYNNAKGEIRVRGNDLSVQGFGISTLARAVPVARQVRDIENASKLALRGGVTRITQLEGMINVQGGKASTPLTTYTSSESKGSVQGSVNLIEETVDLVMDFYLLNTVEEGRTAPQLTLTMQGEIDNVQKELDTQALENYVSQRAAERALGRDR